MRISRISKKSVCLLFRWTLAILTLPSPSEKESASISNERLGEISNRFTIYVPLDSGVKIVFPDTLIFVLGRILEIEQLEQVKTTQRSTTENVLLKISNLARVGNFSLPQPCS